jgi:hypothetical protein
MPSDNDTYLGETLVEGKPASIKQRERLGPWKAAVTRALGGMSEHALELLTLEHPIRSPPRDQVDPCLVSR